MIITIPNRGEIELPDGVDPETINQIVEREFPPTGADIASALAENPTLDKELTDDQFKAYKAHLDTQSHSLLEKLPEAFAGMLQTAGQGLRGLATKPTTAIPSTIEGAAQSARGTYGLVTQSENPNSWLFKAKNWLTGSGTVTEQRQQWLEARDFMRKSEELATGQTGMVVDPQYTDPETVAGMSIIADPTLLIPMAGQALKGTALGARVAAAAGKAAQATKIAGALEKVDALGARAAELAGRTGRLAVRPVIAAGDKALDLAGRAIETVAPGLSLGEAKGIAAGVTGAGAAINPIAAQVTAAYGGAKLVDAGLDVAQQTAKLNAGLPSRLGAWARIADGGGEVSNLSRRMAQAGAAVEPLADAATTLIKGGIHGGAIGGVLGALNNETEGASEGIGAGMALGGLGAVAGRAYARATGKLSAVEAGGDVLRYAAERPDKQRIVSLLDRFQPAQVADITDTARVMERNGTRVHFVDESTLPTFVKDPTSGLQWFASEPEALQYAASKGIPVANLDRPSYRGVSVNGKDVFLNTDLLTSDTAIHEAQHALQKTLAASALSDTIVSAIGDQMSPQDWTGFADAYIAQATSGRLELPQDLVAARNTIASGTGDITAAKKLIADEFASAYAGRWIENKPAGYLLDGQRSLFRKIFDSVKGRWLDRLTVDAAANGWDFSQGIEAGLETDGKRRRITALDSALERAFKERPLRDNRPIDVRGMPLEQAAKILQVEGADALLKTDADGKVVGLKTGRELGAETQQLFDDVANRLNALPADQRATATTLDSKGRPIIRGERLSPQEIQAIQQSPFLSQSARENLAKIGASLATSDGKQIFRGRYWKVYGESRTGKKVAGVHPVSERLLLPYQVEANAQGGIFVRFLDVTRAQERLQKALKLPEYKNLYPDFAAAWAELTTKLLPNYDQPGAAPGAQALGGGEVGNAKRNLFYEALGTVPRTVENPTILQNAPRPGYHPTRKGGHTFESMRIERIATLEETGMRTPFSESRAYENTLRNFQPAETVEAAAILDKNGKVWTGYNHADAWEKAVNSHGTTEIGIPQGGDGFVTNSGRFLTRAEAYELAKTNKQLSRRDAKHPEFTEYGPRLEAETFDQLRRYQPHEAAQDIVLAEEKTSASGTPSQLSLRLTPDLLSRLRFSPPELLPEREAPHEKLAGKTAFIMFADRMKVGTYTSRSGKEFYLRGGADHPDIIDNHKKNVAWAVDAGNIATRLANAIKSTDGIGLVALQGEDAVAGNRTFTAILLDELQHDLRKTRGMKTVMRENLVNANAAIKKWATDNEKKSWLRYRLRSLDQYAADYRSMPFDLKKTINAQLAPQSNTKLGAIGWKDLARELSGFKEAEGYRTGDIVKAIQFDQTDPIVDPQDINHPAHESYSKYVRGTSLGNIKGRLSLFQVLRDSLNKEAAHRNISADGKIGSGAMTYVYFNALDNPKLRVPLSDATLKVYSYSQPLDFKFSSQPERAQLDYRNQLNRELGASVRMQPADDMGNAKLRSSIERQLRDGKIETLAAAVQKVRENGWEHVTQHALKYAQQARTELLAGAVKPRTVAKGYSITLASIGANSVQIDTVAKAAKQLGLDFKPEAIFLDKEKSTKGIDKIRPEEAFAWWLGTKNGQVALNDIERGVYNAKAWQEGIDFRNAYGRNDLQKKAIVSGEAPAVGRYTVTLDGKPVAVEAKLSEKTGLIRWSTTLDGDPPTSVVLPEGLTHKIIFKPQAHGKLKNPLNEYNLQNILKLTDDINATKGDPEKLATVLLKIKGIAAAKKGFLGHLLGYSNWVTSDAVEINAINAGVGDPKLEQSKVSPAQKKNINIWNAAVKSTLLNQFVNDVITTQVMGVFDNIKAETGWSDDLAGHLTHHAMWDAYKGTQTTHEGMYQAMRNFQPAEGFLVEDLPAGRVLSNTDGYQIIKSARAYRVFDSTGNLLSLHDSLDDATQKVDSTAALAANNVKQFPIDKVVKGRSNWPSEQLNGGTVMHSPTGHRIVQIAPNAKYRLYAPDGSLIAVAATAQEAQRRAERLAGKQLPVATP